MAAGEPAVIVAVRESKPACLLLAQDEGFTGFALGIQ
jgi:hypothetical protein